MRYKLVTDIFNGYFIIDTAFKSTIHDYFFSIGGYPTIKRIFNLFRSCTSNTDKSRIFLYFDYRYIGIDNILLEFNTLEEFENKYMEYLI